MTPPTAPRGTPVYPGIAELRAEAPMAGHGPLWQINGRMEGGASDDPEAWGWLAEVSPAWDDRDGGELARLIVQAVNAHAPLVEALSRFIVDDGHTAGCLAAEDGHPCLPRCAQARAALKLARGEGEQ